MGRTINGKEIKEVMLLLSAHQKPDERLQGKYPYYKIESYYKKINEVIGVEHYTVAYTDRTYTEINSNQELLSVKCRITLLDDDFTPICFKEGYGGKEVEYGEKNGKQAGLKNMDNNAALNAFKAAWHQFNIFGRATEAEVNGSGKTSTNASSAGESATNSANTKPATNNNTAATAVCLATQGEIYEEKQSRGKPVYKVKTLVIANNSLTEEVVEVIFYHNQYSKNMDTFNLHKKHCKERSVRLDILGSYTADRNGVKQFVFKGWAA